MIRTVHVIFKTHLDIGFTDLAENVIDQYVNLYIPKAIELAEKLEEAGGRERFLWTTGSWLINHYLKVSSQEDREKMVQAINNGHIAWHGLPFTTHTELLNPDLLEYGLSVSKKLDEKFDKTTIAAKMTDVPGHTISMVPYIVKSGIKYLHLGVNPASKVPKLPKLFRWRAEDGSEVIVNYADNYGEVVQVEGLEDALVFAHTGDNCGPSSPDEIREQFEELAEKFPGATIKASTMDAFAKELLKVKDKLPVVQEEIGDTWIHGAGTDPYKLAGYREFIRKRSEWLRDGKLVPGTEEYEEVSDQLSLIAEHTWGMDLKKYLPDYTNYAKSDFTRARQNNSFDTDMIPDKYGYIGAFAMNEMDENSKELFLKKEKNYSYEVFESSWKEQRDYLNKALSALDEEKRSEMEEALAGIKGGPEQLEATEDLNFRKKYQLGTFDVAFDFNGSIVSLHDSKEKQWADERHALGLFTYETFGQENYNHWFETYMSNLKQTHPWSDSDFGKPGFEYAEPKPKHSLYEPVAESLELRRGEAEDVVQVRLVMPKEPVKYNGSPERVIVEYNFSKVKDDIEVTLYWENKEANRLPEASWFSFTPIVDNANQWKLHKVGSNISPLNVVKDGNRNLHAVDKGVTYQGTDGTLEIETLDAALVCPGERKLLRFDNHFAPLEGGMHVNLHNNIWGTNFPMWYEEDAKFRFHLSFQANV
ncbi:DUF5054 domain-containing protein [Bacillus shivajii]|uniref:DUF5054 domain-containing protein n=1 Tax=Bacillus shivajii TaxID=1983719 RepID=UPI001CF9717B|nr:DUF5054 domain-containing protein [Bacillus shivajii]UCZ52788.1 DUF5054 domain-containing protein [Bacillus shivajii]